MTRFFWTGIDPLIVYDGILFNCLHLDDISYDNGLTSVPSGSDMERGHS